jgi:hypothetical protein
VEPANDQPFHLGKSLKEHLNKRPPKPVGIVQLLNVVEIVQIFKLFNVLIRWNLLVASSPYPWVLGSRDTDLVVFVLSLELPRVNEHLY